jgi:hypothetical protein
VLDPDMKKDDQVLVLLYSKPSWCTEEDVLDWVEYSNPNVFRKKVLRALHKKRLIEYDPHQHRARISPRGANHVEQTILNTRTP